jgi:hypothetical protein
VEIRAFQPQDLHAISLQNAQMGVHELITYDHYGESLAAAGPAFTATVDGEVIACIGTIPQWKDYARAWALLSRHSGKNLLALTRGIRRWLRFHNAGRVDTAVACDFPQAIRWAQMLGFEREGVMRKYAEGKDFYLYAQVI